MSTILQPCFESQFIETTTFKLKFAPSSNSNSSSDVCGGLSFQQILAGICSGGGGDTNTTPVVEKESVYVHPLSKRSSSSYSSSSRILSEKSFEMCTENLGSETGTDDVMDINILSSSSSSSSNPSSPLPSPSPSPSPREYSPRSSKKLHSSSRNFPPPLTTISGANSLQVRSHRENGRLVLKAIESPIRHSFLQAERSNGRLTLTLHKHLDTQEENQEQELEEFEEEEEEEEENEISPINNQDSEEIDDDDDDESDANFVPPNNNNNNNNYDDIHGQEEEVYEMGREKYKRISTRCNIMNEGHGGRTNTVLCKPLWVATS